MNKGQCRVLVFGEGSYIGRSFVRFAAARSDVENSGTGFEVSGLSSRGDSWKGVDFSSFDTVLFCAGIAHVSPKKVPRDVYFAVNCDLAVEVAKKAKRDGVGQFVFLSTMAAASPLVTSADFGGNVVTRGSSAVNFYGQSKYEAEKQLQALESGNFKICIVRPPMVYGAGCKGNFPRLVRLAKHTPIFPDVPNKRSMIFIDNLCAFLLRLIENGSRGVYLPQNREWVNTTELVVLIRQALGKKTYTTKIFNWLIRLFMGLPVVNKLFGSLVYARDNDDFLCGEVEFGESVRASLMD
ncbi:MAG: NAD-dependent epimerase/dehydratase family protein [Defluviitaleaceae bacterium]|nr:NAD-dependent epimerase/dehydratase family protein [Defluviitaleaceae bacterium]